MRRTLSSRGARTLNDLRERWLNPEGATEADLKKHTLTHLYNARPTWLQIALATLDRAVWDASGWPAAVEEDVILSRLLTVNGKRIRIHRSMMGYRPKAGS